MSMKKDFSTLDKLNKFNEVHEEDLERIRQEIKTEAI